VCVCVYIKESGILVEVYNISHFLLLYTVAHPATRAEQGTARPCAMDEDFLYSRTLFKDKNSNIEGQQVLIFDRYSSKKMRIIKHLSITTVIPFSFFLLISPFVPL